jgi:eukaryotic-like serine/threonine-protein kinase
MSGLKGTHFGPYEITALIGVGGMGEVYRATDTNLKRDVALKVLPESFATDAARLARLQREAEMLAALNHPNIAQIYGLERSNGRNALVLELVDGPTLAERIAEGPLPPDEALNVAHQIAAALEAAHERGIVHRDLKPANIQIKPDGTVKVLDFGIAKALDARAAATSGPQPALTTPAATEIGVVLGTAAYMSPEQARGRTVDRRADVWAFGCVLYEMLTGESAFLGEDVSATLARVLEREPNLRKLPSSLPSTVRSTIELCLQKDPKKRLRDIGDVRLALEGQLVGVSHGASRPFARRVLPIAAAVVVGAVLAAALVASLLKAPEPATVQQAALPVTRFVITPEATAPLASLGGYDVMISPDGKRIAYFGQDPTDRSVALYVRELDGLEARRVPGTDISATGSAAGGNMNPFFSADSQSIGFLAPARGIIRVALDGGPPIEIADAPPFFLGASWTADDAIVYSAGRSLHRVSAGGDTAPERLTEEMPNTFVASPVVLPGGRAIMYGFVQGNVERVAVFDLDRREQKIIVDNGQNAFYSDTGHVVFARGTTIMAAPFDAAELEVTGEPVAMIDNVRHPAAITAADYALSATGTLVYVPDDGLTPRASPVWVDRAGNLLGRAISEPVENPRDPALSPDGTRLVLTTGPPNDGDLWSYDLRGRPPIRLAVVGDDVAAAWSPDGRQVAFTMRAEGTGGAHTVLADGSMLAPRPLRAEPVPGGVRDWTATGELLLVRGPLTTTNIVAVPVIGDGPAREVVATEYADFDPALSPDGRWLAYASTRTGRNEIWVQGYPEGVAVRVSSNGGFEPRWATNGRELYYLQQDTMMAVAVETGDELSFSAPEQLFTGPYRVLADPTARSYDVAPDGRFVMVALDDGSETGAPPSNIVVVQNWTEELKRRVPGR